MKRFFFFRSIPSRSHNFGDDTFGEKFIDIHMNNCYILDVFYVIIIRDFPDLILRIKYEEIGSELN